METTQEKKFKVYKSSAGSGKTFTLVKEFLKLCFKTESAFAFSSILAITFTNKATYEMKNRILQALEELSHINVDEKASVLASVLVKESGLSITDIKERSQKILTAILHNYADFNISTIDRFSHRLIRTFAKDLGLSMGFQVDVEETELLQRVAGELIDSIGEEKRLTHLLLDFALYKIEAEKSWGIETDLFDFSKNLFNEGAEFYLNALRGKEIKAFDETREAYLKKNEAFERRIKEIAKTAVELIRQNGIEDRSFAGRSKISVYFRRLLQFDSKNLKPSASLSKDVKEDNWYATKCTADQKSRIDKVKGELSNSFEEIQQILAENFPEFLSRQEINKHIHSLSLLNEIEKRIAALKKEEKLLNISDFNKLIAKVVLSEPMPFIYERLGDRFQHIMIDEFQDTSVLQYMNLMPLIEDSLSKGKENLIVGDAKQAIYRFRGGEVEQFSEMPDYIPSIAEENELIPMRLETLKSQYNQQNLNINYRSSNQVITFNNAFFDFVKTEVPISDKVRKIFDGHQQQLAKEKDSGFVSVSFTDKKNTGDSHPMESLVLSDIQNCITDGFRLKDIAVLCRTKKDAISIAEFLTAEKIAIISSEALLLKNSKEVYFLICMLQWILQEDDQLAQKEIVQYLFTVGRLKGTMNENFVNYLKSNDQFKSVFDSIGVKIDVKELRQLAVHEFFEALIRIFELNKKYNSFLQGLQDEAFDFVKSYHGSARQFLLWWEQNQHKLSVETPDNLDAISILTIHKSKGLEFPVVIYPFAKQKVEHSGAMKKSYLWTPTLASAESKIPYALVEFNGNLSESSLASVYQEELEKKEMDLINDTYVAFTRASERLYIHAEAPSKSSKLLSLPAMLQSFLFSRGIEPNENDRYSFGKEEEHIAADAKPREEISIDYLSNSWKSKLQISQESIQLWEEESYDSSPRNYGTFLHNVLAKIKAEKDVKRAVRSFELAGDIEASEATALEQKILKLIAIKEVKPFFADKLKVKNEATLLSEKGEFLRPDRVVYFDDFIAVIDYKTGELNDSYQKQLNQYRNTISKTTDLPVKAYILYTEKEQLIEIN